MLPCRQYEDMHRCSQHMCFHVVTTERGDKSVANIEPMLKLPPCAKLEELIKHAGQDQTATKANLIKAMLGEITTDEFRQKFKCHFWGDISFLDQSSDVKAASLRPPVTLRYRMHCMLH